MRTSIYQKNDLLLVTLIFLISFTVRVYKITSHLFFGFEQGRDAQIIEKIYTLADFVLVGPSTSIGGVFHGPWYYYLLALPYGVSSGNPVAASIFLIILGSLVPVVMYFLGKELFNSKLWGIVVGVVTIFSYEYILYSRWLSNVSPAPLFIALAFLMLWKFCKKNNQFYFLGFVASAILAMSFQMILSIQFIFAVILLFVFRQLKLPTLRTILLSLLIILFLYFPLILFDFRNQHITFNSLVNFGNGSERKDGNLVGGLVVYFTQIRHHISLSVTNISNIWFQAGLITLILFASIIDFKNLRNRGKLFFLYSWTFMSLPLIWVSPGNPQYYVGVGLGWILLFCFALKTFWESKQLRIIPVVFSMMFIVGIFLSLYNLNFHKDVFFRTFQDDLNYADQKSVLDFIHKDSDGQTYQLSAFTIPSLHPEAWEYLHKYYYPDDKSSDARIVYIVIEKYVYPVWENKWINDLGNTKLIFEKKFGLLRLQKRERID